MLSHYHGNTAPHQIYCPITMVTTINMPPHYHGNRVQHQICRPITMVTQHQICCPTTRAPHQICCPITMVTQHNTKYAVPLPWQQTQNNKNMLLYFYQCRPCHDVVHYCAIHLCQTKNIIISCLLG